MKPIYIHSAVSISAQNSFTKREWEVLEKNREIVPAIHPDYREYIPAVAARRMAPAVKMGVTAAKEALKRAKGMQPDAIITGSGMGCMQDTEKFLNALLENKEQFLTPTAFIQSTHNTVGAQIALGLQCKAYNNTYVHGSLSFESALVDAQLLLQEEAGTYILVGGVDELGTEFVKYVASRDAKETPSRNVPMSEGASFFVLSTEENENGIILKDMTTFRDAAIEDISKKMVRFLNKNQLTIKDVDLLLLGNNGDASNVYYDAVSAIFSDSVERIPFKEYSGEYYTVMGFAMWWAFQILTDQAEGTPQTILLYNQEKGSAHSFMMISRC